VCTVLFAGTVLLAPPGAASPLGASGASTGPGAAASPWTAADHLRTEVEGITAPGWWLELGALSREAVAGEWEGGVRGGFTGSRFPGIVAGWRRTGGNGSAATHDRELRLVLPWARGRVSAGVRVLQRETRRSLSLPVQAAIATGGPFVAGAAVVFRPGGAAGSADAALFATAASGRWMGAIEAGSPARVRASVGIGITPDLLWSVGIADLDPTYALHVRLGAAEIRAETTAHRALGAVTRIRFLWTEAGS
jgi:hypothetical protein